MRIDRSWQTRFGAVLLSAMLAIGVSCMAEHPESEHPQGQNEHPQAEEHGAEHPQEGHEEHPDAEAHAEEHPESGGGHEHPDEAHSSEHPEEGHEKKHKPVTKDRMADAIEDYVEKDMELKGNYFLFFDSEKNEVLTLKLDHVHRERVAQTADNRYFVCADFRHMRPGPADASGKGKIYDLDFWMKRGEHGDLHVTDITLHKEAGEARYTWYEEDGVWKRKQK